MSPSPGTAPRHRWSAIEHWIGRLGLFAAVIGIAIVAGMQFAQPDKRILQVIAAVAVVYLAFRSKSISALMLAVLFIPFPKGTSYGNTNLAFLLLIFVVWIFRITTGRARTVGRTPLDIPVLGLVMAYGLSFYNVTNPEHIPLALKQLANFLTYVGCMYMVVNIVRTTDDVRKVLVTQCISCGIVCLLALYEQARPGTAIISGWIDFSSTNSALGKTVRTGSTFLDYELFGEYCALNIIIQMFMFQRAGSRSRRWLLACQILLTVYCLFATVTRGAIITFLLGLVCLAWLSRTRLNFVKLTSASALVVGLIGGVDFLTSHYTKSGSLLERLFATHIENGVPDTRAPAWKAVWARVVQSPIIGHGPYYSLEKGLGLEWWPHNVYLYYAYIVGVVGLAFYLWILSRLWQATRVRALSFGDGTFIGGATVLARVILVMFMIDQLKIDYLRNSIYSYFIWFLFGLIVAIGNVASAEATSGAAAERATRGVTPAPKRWPTGSRLDQGRAHLPQSVAAVPAVKTS